MPTTGFDLYRLFSEGVDKDYTEYVNPDRFNRLIKNCFINLTESIYREKDTQKEHDELSELTKVDFPISINNNRFHIRPLLITSITVNGLLLIIEFQDDHNLEVGNNITIQDVQNITSNPPVNGTHPVTGLINGRTVELNFAVPPAGIYLPDTGRMVHERMVPDYYHLFALKCQFIESPEVYQIETITGGSVRIKFRNRNIIRQGNQIRIDGVVGTTSANGLHYVKEVGRTTFDLYQDEKLLQPVLSNAAYIEGGTVQEVVYRYADRLSSDQKYAETEKATVKDPKFIEEQSTFKIYPSLYECSEVKLDYLIKPEIEVDANDQVRDLELNYSLKLLYRLKDQCMVRFLNEIQDLNKMGATEDLTMTNR